jgi:hypothetical protein
VMNIDLRRMDGIFKSYTIVPYDHIAQSDDMR